MNNSNNSPNLRPVLKIELDDSNLSKRLWVLLVVFAVAIVALTVAINGFIRIETGRTFIQANPTVVGSDTDFRLSYDIGSSETLSPRLELKSVTTAYSAACDEAYKLFSTTTAFDGVKNIKYINDHPNEEITVSEELYSAFELIKKYDSRLIYLAPLSVDYMNLFMSESDILSEEFDPYINEELAKEHTETAAYANNPNQVDIRLLGDNKLMLFVSDEYLSYAEGLGIGEYIDLMWLKNAFSADYIAKSLVSQGFESGMLTTTDGFSHNLNRTTNEEASLIIADKHGINQDEFTLVKYHLTANVCYLRSYKLNPLDDFYCYERQDGETRTYYLDPSDGKCRTACDAFIGASKELGCAELALKMATIYISETLDENKLKEFSKNCSYIVVGDKGIKNIGDIFTVDSNGGN